MFIQDFVFLDSSSATTSSNECRLSPEAKMLEFQVSDTPTGLKLYGKIDVESEDWTEMAVFSTTDFSQVSPISATGTFVASVEGFSLIKFTHTGSAGSVKVYGRCTC